MLKPTQLEELERLHDEDNFEEPREGRDAFDDGAADSAAAWRRGMIENALANVKNATGRLAKIGGVYEPGMLVFDEHTRKFARILYAGADALELEYISGGKGHFGSRIERDEEEVLMDELETGIKASPMASPDDGAPSEAIVKAVPKITKPKSTRSKSSTTRATAKSATKTKKVATPKRPAVRAPKKAAPQKPAAKKATNFTSHIPEGFTTDPVADPNGYIQQNFQLMNNKEMAEVTGLSEHTIRRKLGEWGLKRVRK